MKRKSLVKLFALVFILFAAGTIIVNVNMTYVAQTRSYHNQCVGDLRKLTTYLTRMIRNRGDEFIHLKAWFQEYPDQVQIPVDFKADLPRTREAFEHYIAENYQGRIFGSDLRFEDLDHEGQRLYVNYSFEYWFTMFFDAVEDFELSYVYFIYPENEQDLTMNYMFDPTMGTVTAEDGREILKLGDIVYEDPAIHKYMWEAWNSGNTQDGFDDLNNEFGHVYTYCVPLILEGEKIGLVCSEISVEHVTSEIMSNVIVQGMAIATVLMVFTAVLYALLQSHVLERIVRMEKAVNSYTQSKDPALAAKITANAGRPDEIGILAVSFGDMITELSDYMVNLQRVTAEKERIGAELNVATQIQADMLPRIFPAFPEKKELSIYADMTPAKEVGGDFYDFFLVDDTHLAMVIADVSGKGVPAALFMVIAKTLIKNQLQMGVTPSEALENVNNQLCEGNEAELFVTVWAAVIDLDTGDVLETNAGHEYPAIRRKNGLYELVKARHSPAVAAMEGMKFRQREFHMDPGDRLCVYTDGVTEATNAHNEMFGEARLLEALNRYPDAEVKELLTGIKQAIDNFVGDAPQFDDITMLSFIYYGKGTDAVSGIEAGKAAESSSENNESGDISV